MPNTEEGKARSRMNALKHGLRATDDMFIAHLKPAERTTFSKIRNSLHEHLKPQTEQEQDLVDRIAIQHFRLYRLYDLENIAVARNEDSLAVELERYARYDWRIERQLTTLFNQLRSLYIMRNDFSLTLFRRNVHG
jgi:hypothetical protein